MQIHRRVKWQIHISLLDWYSPASYYFENIIFHRLTFLLYQVNFRTISFPCYTPFQEMTEYLRINMKSKQ